MPASWNSYRSCAAQLGVVVAVVSISLIVPAAVAQYSSSVQFHQDLAPMVQDQNPNQGGYPTQRYNQSLDNSLINHIAVEAGGGFNRPVGYARTFSTWGGNVALGRPGSLTGGSVR